MKVLHAGWGFHPRGDGGAPLLQWEMTQACRKLGYHTVLYQSGTYDFFGRTRLRRRCVAGGTVIFDLINSPNRPGLRDPTSHVSNTCIVELSQQVLERVRPDVVHVHDLTFHCAGLIDLCTKMRIPVVKTIHNYWDLCPRGDLLFNGQQNCTDFWDGWRCVHCRPVWRLRPWLAATARILGRTPLFSTARDFWHTLQRFGGRAWRSQPIGGDEPHLPTGIGFVELAHQYASRRSRFVSSLNSAQCIHVYSRHSGQLMKQYGIRKERILYFPVTTTVIDAIKPRTSHTGQLPIVFGYRGALAPHKGVHVLIEAYRHVGSHKTKLLVFGSGSTAYEERLRRLAEGTNVEFRGRYHPSETCRINSEIDVGIVPSIWEEVFGLVGIEYVQSRVPLIGSDIGGIAEYIVHGSTGFLVKPDSPQDLAAAMLSFIERPSLVEQLQSQITPWCSIETMTEHLASLYAEAVTAHD